DEAGNGYAAMTAASDNGEETIIERMRYNSDIIWLKADFNFENSADTVDFAYSADGKRWEPIGRRVQLKYTLDHFMGCRIGLYNYASIEAGGYVDIDYFHYKKHDN